MEQKYRAYPIFRSTFSITDRDAFDQAVEVCKKWIMQKGVSKNQFPAGESGTFTGKGCHGSVRMIDHEDGRIWAARLEDTREADQARKWTTDLFVEYRAKSLVRFGAELLLRSASSDENRFSHSRPRVVKDILATLSAEADGVALMEKPQVVSASEVDELVALLTKPGRRLPIVAMSRDELGELQLDPDKAGNYLSGASHVRILESEACWELTRRMGKAWSVYNRAVRIYFSGVSEDDDPYRHPISLANSARPGDQVLNWLCARVLPAGFKDQEQEARFWRVGLLQYVAQVTPSASDANITVASVDALKAQLVQAKQDQETAEALMNEADRLRADAESERDRMRAELDTVRDALRAPPPTAVGQGLGPREVEPLINGSLGVTDALNIIERLFPERIKVLPSARVAAGESEGFRFPQQLLELLWKLVTDYWAKMVGGSGDIEARKVFGTAYAPKESPKISNSGRKMRTFEYNRREIFMEKHLKIGVKDSPATTIRVHFEWIAEERCIIIGYCGPHLPF